MANMNVHTLKKRTSGIYSKLRKNYPDAKCALHYKNPLQLLVATILSAQCTDVRVNKVTPPLFKKYKTSADFAKAKPADVQKFVRSTGFFQNKTKSILGACKAISDDHKGQVPDNMQDLVKLPGVGRKTANVILGNAFNIPGITVDTHMGRLSRRMGLTKQTDPVKVELDLMQLVPKKEWTRFSHIMIYHGRAICNARKPLCSKCSVEKLCPKVGVTKHG